MATILSSPNDSPKERLRNRKQPLTSRAKATFSPDRFALNSQAILGFLGHVITPLPEWLYGSM